MGKGEGGEDDGLTRQSTVFPRTNEAIETIERSRPDHLYGVAARARIRVQQTGSCRIRAPADLTFEWYGPATGRQRNSAGFEDTLCLCSR
jgi:hypothetical protein